MTSLLKFTLLWCNPIWYMFFIPYFIVSRIPVWLVKLFWFPINTCKGIYKASKWGWNLFTPLWAKLLVASFAVFTAIPGTWTAVFYYVAHATGYGEHADWLVDKVVGIATFTWMMGSVIYDLAVA